MLLPVDDVLSMEVFQPTGNFSCVEDGPLLLEAGIAHVVNVKLEIPAIHQCQHKTQGILHLKCICQVHLSKHQHHTHHHKQ